MKKKPAPPPAKKIAEGDLVKVLYVYSFSMITIKEGICYYAVLQFPATTSVHAVEISAETFLALKGQGVKAFTQEQHHARWAGKVEAL